MKKKYKNAKTRRIGWFNLKAQLTTLVTAELVVGILVSVGVVMLIRYGFGWDLHSPLLPQIAVLTLAFMIVGTRFLSKMFFDPIKRLREGMKQVADGDFSVQLTTRSSSPEIQEMFQSFNLMVQELRATEILQSDFVSGVSHEFKTPINAIEGYAMLLQGSGDQSDEQQQYVDKILFNTKRLSDLVGNILLLSKIENQSIETDRTRFRLDEQIRQSIVGLESAWEARETEFDVELDSVEYLGGEAMLRHVWDNLIGNAIKFGPQGGTVRLRLSQMEDGILFTVEDEGPGLSDEAKKHIFDKFYQADTSHKQEGYGLGLALVKRILTAAGGSVAAENREEGGCRFTVKLSK